MGRYLILMVTGMMMLFSTIALKLNQNRTSATEANARAYSIAVAKNLSTSGAYMAVSKMSLDNTWREGFSNLSLGGAVGSVHIDDSHSNASLSGSELLITSIGTFDEIAETTLVSLKNPPNIGDFALYATDEVNKINVYDEHGREDSTLLVENAGELPPVDWDALEALAIAQNAVDGNGSHIISGNGNGGIINNDESGNSGKKVSSNDKKSDDCDFYNSEGVPNVTVIYGDLTISGNTKICGIFIVYGDFTLNGNVEIQGVIAMPQPGTAIMHGGGNKKIMNITGGMFVDASVTGTGNHVSVKYDPEYMSIFADFQKESTFMLTRWLESASF